MPSMRRSTTIALLILAGLGCSSAHSRTNAEREQPPEAGAGSAGLAHTPAPEKALAAEGPSEPPLPEYRAQYLRELTRLTKSREAKVPPQDGVREETGPVPFTVEVLKKLGQSDSEVVTTVGFGRLPHGKGRSRVELLAYVEHYGPRIGKVLAALGRVMHAGGPEAPSWKEYDTVKLETPEQDMTYFDLRPAGEVDLGPDRRVVMLKVIPMSEEEFDKTQKNAAGEWDDPNATTRAKERWGRLLQP